MTALAEKECVACKGGVPPLKGEELAKLANQLDGGWQVVAEHHLEKEYKFYNFREALDFTNKVGALAEAQGHHPDIYLACDYGTDRLFFNNGDGTFRDATETAIGIDTRKGMNVDVGDYDNDGWLDIYVTNITDEYMKECNMLWHNNADGTFTDLARETGTCETLWGWAAKFGPSRRPIGASPRSPAAGDASLTFCESSHVHSNDQTQ